MSSESSNQITKIEDRILELQESLKTIQDQLESAKRGSNPKFQLNSDWFIRASDAQRHQRNELQNLVAQKRYLQDGHPVEGPTSKAFLRPPRNASQAPDRDLVRERIACLLRLAKAANVVFGEVSSNEDELTREQRFALEDQVEKAEEDIVSQLDLLDSLWEGWESAI